MPLAAGETAPAEGESQRVLVGVYSIYPTATAEGPLPVAVYPRQTLEQFGAMTLGEGLRHDPSSLGNTATENISNGGEGTARLNLRALGAPNTVVLINGRRTFAFSDLNAVPLAALNRAEILRAGSSTVYGLDALGGTLNLILLSGPGTAPFNGVEINLLYGNTTDRDARVLQSTLRAGFGSEKFRIGVVVEYYQWDALYARDRELSASTDRLALGGLNIGSRQFPGRITLGGVDRVLIDPASLPSGASSYRAYGGALSGDPFNFQQFAPTIPAQERESIYATATFLPFGDRRMKLQADVLYSRTRQDNGLAAAPTSFGRSASLTSPYDPFARGLGSGPLLTGVGYRFTRELGNRTTVFETDSLRSSVSLSGDWANRGSIIQSVSYDAGVVWENVDRTQTSAGVVVPSRLTSSIATGQFNPFIGSAAPLSGMATTFNAASAPAGTARYDNLAAAQAAAYTGRIATGERGLLADLRLGMSAFPDLPTNGIGLAGGLEYRRRRTQQDDVSPGLRPDEAAEVGSNPERAEELVRSAWLEASIPILTPTMRIPGVHSLDLSLGVRWESTEVSQRLATDGLNVFTGEPVPQHRRYGSGPRPRFALTYAPANWLLFRGSYAENVRTPSAKELFASLSSDFPTLYDPSTGPRQVEVDSTGNASPAPEKSQTWAAGFALTPPSLQGLAWTLDYYQTFTRGVILSPADVAEFELYLKQSSGSLLSAPGLGVISPNLVKAEPQNGGKRLVSGIESTLAYERRTESAGVLNFTLATHYLLAWKAEVFPGFGAVNYLGGNSRGVGSLPRWKGYFRSAWEYRNFSVSGTLNFVGDFHDDPHFLANPAGDRKVPAYATFDLQLAYEFKRPAPPVGSNPRPPPPATWAQKLAEGMKLRVGVVNLFDRSPPAVFGGTNDNYDPSLYTLRNRFFYTQIAKRF